MKELNDLISHVGLDAAKVIKLISGGGSINHSFNVEPEEFLEQAELDFESGGKGALLNAITNAKRAIHGQIDKTLISLGFDPLRWKTYRKIETFVELGFVAPRILNRVNRARNILEHEYTAPTLEQVEDSLDLAALFISATSRHLESFEHEFILGNYNEQTDEYSFQRQLSFNFQVTEKLFRLIGRDRPYDPTRPFLGAKVLTISPYEPIFRCLVRLVTAKEFESKVNNSIKDLFQTVGA